MGDEHDRKQSRDAEAPDTGEKDRFYRYGGAESQQSDVEGHLVRAPAERTFDTADRTL